jgi:hypothetical protein
MPDIAQAHRVPVWYRRPFGRQGRTRVFLLGGVVVAVMVALGILSGRHSPTPAQPAPSRMDRISAELIWTVHQGCAGSNVRPTSYRSEGNFEDYDYLVSDAAGPDSQAEVQIPAGASLQQVTGWVDSHSAKVYLGCDVLGFGG